MTKKENAVIKKCNVICVYVITLDLCRYSKDADDVKESSMTGLATQSILNLAERLMCGVMCAIRE